MLKIFWIPLVIFPALLWAQPPATIFFMQHADIGRVKEPGALAYHNPSQEYALRASGSQAVHFTWKKLKGDFILQARVRLDEKGSGHEAKAGLMIRESTDDASSLVAAFVHRDGTAKIAYRKASGAPMGEFRSRVTGPDMLQLERKGKVLILSMARFGEPYTITTVQDVPTADEVYAGLFVQTASGEVPEHARFSNVQIIIPTPSQFQAYKDYLGSHIETMEVSSGHREIVYTDWNKSLQAPNWMPDGRSLIYNSEGLIYQLQLADKTISVLPTGAVQQNNNDHVISFDGKWLGLSSSSGEAAFGSLVYMVPLRGGNPRRVTPLGPSYLHGFSPDGKWMTYTGLRNNEYDIYKIPSAGGNEIRLTDAPGLDDGSEYSPDGKYIYFNSVRSGSMQLWRMRPDGSQQEQLTRDEFNNWFPHISPDGRWIIFLSYTNEVAPGDHPFYKKVYLRLMPADLSTAPHVVAYLYGGQGTINTPSWSPDSKKIAFVSNSGKLE